MSHRVSAKPLILPQNAVMVALVEGVKSLSRLDGALHDIVEELRAKIKCDGNMGLDIDQLRRGCGDGDRVRGEGFEVGGRARRHGREGVGETGSDEESDDD